METWQTVLLTIGAMAAFLILVMVAIFTITYGQYAGWTKRFRRLRRRRQH